MKRTKNVKLVLISSLIGSGGAIFANNIHAGSQKSMSDISYTIKNSVTRSGKDTVTHTHSGATVVPRGGFGATGHHSNAAS